jgi:hypothetical protein
MNAYDPTRDPEKIRVAIETIHQKLRDEIGDGVTLKNVTDKFNETFGLNWSEEQVAPYLDSDLKARRAQGRTDTAAKAHTLSDLAAEASANARANGDAQSHFTAAAAHEDAMRACKAAMDFHSKSAAYHSDKAAGRNPAEMEGE